MPDDGAIEARLTFLREAERLKDVLRSAHTRSGRQESSAEHSWRLCLWAMVFADMAVGAGRTLDRTRLLELCVLHDLGEAISGDVPATRQHADDGRAARERADLQTLSAALPAHLRAHFLALWDEYRDAATPEAVLVKGLDKLETIMQHHQGRNPAGFDHAFNLLYGADRTAAHPLLARIRALLDEETRARLG
ncbi:MAG: HD domain-containing protein [Geminicoccaceae bacterium]|nr:HD domain-containing protein [Geminicoccaceae bacterium]